MTAAAAARNWWARTRRASGPGPVFAAPETGAASPKDIDVRSARLSLAMPALFAGAMLLCGAIGFAVTVFCENKLAYDRHAALRQALDELGGTPDRMIGDAELRQIERRSGLKELRFAREPGNRAGRELQSVHDGRGRIVGWFSYAADDTLLRSMNRLWVLIGAIGAVFAVPSLIAARSSRRLIGLLDRSAGTLHRLSREDALTGLPNHRALIERLNEALARPRSGTVVFALVDLDGFREVNDTLGRSGGDAVMFAIAEHLKSALPAAALLARFEEDEFAVIAAGEERKMAATLADALRTALQRPVFVERMWQISAGIGIAQAPDDGTTADEIMRRAGLALRAAKRDGRGRVRFFAPQIETDYAERRFLLRELQTAISLRTFDVHYQPIVAADGAGIVGVEALLRWTHASRGPISPAVFIPLAEQSGLMSQLGEIVLRRALADAIRWPNIFISINLSPLQIRDRWLVDLVGVAMAETGIASSRVVLEVTEGILIDNPLEALARLEALRALGVAIALDDFGTGFSSMSYLQKFPFERLKIDRAFVASLGTSGNAGAIIQSIVTLGRGLGMKVLAEGVETDEQRVLLRLAGCDEMQGFLFAKPAPAAEIDKLLARNVVRAAVG